MNKTKKKAYPIFYHLISMEDRMNILMDILNVILTSLGSITVLFLLTKLMGNREISELSMFDYVNGITIGSIAAEMATDLEKADETVTAMVIYAVVVFILAKLSEKSVKVRRFVGGRPLVLLNNDQIYFKNLKKGRLDLDEFLCQCRVSGYFDLSQIQTIILESNGKFSILPKADYRPATPKDIGIKVPAEALQATVIVDGNVMHKNLHHIGKDEKWLHSQLTSQGFKSESEIFLALCDIHNKVTFFKKLEENPTRDILD